jgi:hypothetical protein
MHARVTVLFDSSNLYYCTQSLVVSGTFWWKLEMFSLVSAASKIIIGREYLILLNFGI